MRAIRTALVAVAFFWVQTLSSSSAPQLAQEVASVEGIVSELRAGAPLAGVRVVLSTADGAAGALATLTDSAGRFVFRSVTPGTYRVIATRDGYGRSEYGQRGPNQAGVPITVLARQQAPAVVITMIPTSAISGRIFDRFGEPLAQANVQALKWAYENGRRVLTPAQTTLTNDRGEYRLYWLQAGRYVVNAVRAEGARAAEGLPRIEEGSDETYVPVYAPGTTDPVGATLIDLRPGVEVAAVDVRLPEIRTVSVRGRIVSSGASAITRSLVRLVPRTESVVTVAERTSPTTAAGTFEFRGVLPGSYELLAAAAEPVRTANRGEVPNRGSIPVAARASLEVGGADLVNISLVLQPGINIPGQIVFEGVPGRQIPSMPNLRVQLRSEFAVPQISVQSAAEVAPNGTFALTGVLQGVYGLTVTGMSRDSYLKVARLEGSDVLNSGISIDGAPRGRLEIIISSNSGFWDAVVFDKNAAAAAGVTVVLVPDPALRQRSDLYRTALTDAAGRVHIEGLMPGEYKAFAWDDVPRGAWQDSNFIRMYEDRGRAVHIREGGNESVDLRLIPSGM